VSEIACSGVFEIVGAITETVFGLVGKAPFAPFDRRGLVACEGGRWSSGTDESVFMSIVNAIFARSRKRMHNKWTKLLD
jgi:hypothetical protein